MFDCLIDSIQKSFKKEDIIHAFSECGIYPFNPGRIRELAHKNHGIPLDEEMKSNAVYKAINPFLEKKSPLKAPLEAGVVEEGKIYDGLGDVMMRQAHEKLLKEVKEKEKQKKKEERRRKEEKDRHRKRREEEAKRGEVE